MKWYKRFPADFLVKTRHLSLQESGAYNALLDHYYTTERPLPDDPDELYRIANAHSVSEKRAVERIAASFFVSNGSGKLHNKRCDEEIGRAKHVSEQRRIAGIKGQASVRQ